MANSYRDLIAEAHRALEGLAPLTDLELRTAAVHGWVAHDTSAGERSNLWGQFAARASAELLAARARITELEAERPRFSQRQFMQALRDRDEAQSRAAELADHITELEQQASTSLGYVIVIRDSEGELTCCGEVFDPDGVRTAEGIGSGYATKGEQCLIAELREVSDR